MKLGLGAVQFGLDYGISNTHGKTDFGEISRILAVAADRGVRVIDTAANYGNSEASLGRSLIVDHSFAIVTKTPRFIADTISVSDTQLLESTFYESLARLNQNSIYGLLVHNAGDLEKNNANLLMEKMTFLKESGKVKKIGVSIYTAREIDMVLDQFLVDLVQLPISVLDQRLLQSGHIAKLKARGVEIHARSVFLQGLLLMEPEVLPHHFDPIRQHLRAFRHAIQKQGITPVQAAIGFVSGLEDIDVVLCGVNNSRQMEELCSSIEGSFDRRFLDSFGYHDEMILNPSKWGVV